MTRQETQILWHRLEVIRTAIKSATLLDSLEMYHNTYQEILHLLEDLNLISHDIKLCMNDDLYTLYYDKLLQLKKGESYQ